MNSGAARAWTVAGLLTGATGIVVQKLGGMELPAVPPGLVFLVVAAGVLLTTRWRFAPVVAVVAGAAELAGFFGGEAISWLLRDEDLAGLAGTWIRLAGITTAVVAGELATKAAYGKTTKAVHA